MKKILFVDDEPNIINGLKRMLRPLRNEWIMEFATSGSEALDILDKDNFDVVVSDMRMPEMDGAQLLTEVMKRYPHIIRIILSGHSEQKLIFKSARQTHQFLSKPCDAETLKKTITKAFKLHDLLSNNSIKFILSQIDSLPSMPELYQKIMNELQSPDVSVKGVAKIISQDISMTAQILKFVNSSFFGFFKNISDPVQAVSLLGLNTIKTLVLSFEIFSSFSAANTKFFSLDNLYLHSKTTAVLARNFAKSVSTDKHFIEDAFTVGFLHDIGLLLLAAKLPKEFSEIMSEARTNQQPLWKLEYAVLGTSHAEIGAYLLGLWGFSDKIIEPITFHHHLHEDTGDDLSLMTILHFADVYAGELIKPKPDIVLSEIDETYINNMNLQTKREEWFELSKQLEESRDLK